jgi:hypothetical protein
VLDANERCGAFKGWCRVFSSPHVARMPHFPCLHVPTVPLTACARPPARGRGRAGAGGGGGAGGGVVAVVVAVAAAAVVVVAIGIDNRIFIC